MLVTLPATGEPTDASAPVDLTAYRIVQEALTNALKHGGPAARVTIDYGPSRTRWKSLMTDGVGRSVEPHRRIQSDTASLACVSGSRYSKVT